MDEILKKLKNNKIDTLTYNQKQVIYLGMEIIINKIQKNQIGITALSKDQRQFIKGYILLDLQDIKEYIKTTKITKYGVYIYLKNNFMTYDYIPFRSFKDMKQDYKVRINELITSLKK